MLVKSIGSGEFKRLLPSHLVLEHLMAGQVEWFGNRTRNVIGTIARGKGQAGWNYVILRRHKPGSFRVCDVRGNFYSRKAAKADFFVTMKGAGPGRPEDAPRMDGR